MLIFTVARIPTLAPHFGAAAMPHNWNKETQMVPIIGLENPTSIAAGELSNWETLAGDGTFASTQPPRLVKAIAKELEIDDCKSNDDVMWETETLTAEVDSTIVNWELELYDTQPAQVGGIDKEFIFAGRIDDKLCSFAAFEALLESCSCFNTRNCATTNNSGIIKMVGMFDDEEIGSELRQGAAGNLLPSVIERICDVYPDTHHRGPDVLAQTYAKSFLVSADVIHAVNPNFLEVYLENHSPRLNVGVTIEADANGHMTTDAISTTLFQRIAEKSGCKLQVFQIRNDVRSGGTLGPPLSIQTGIRAIDAGCPQLSMHSIRATTGSLDPGLGVKMYLGFLQHFEDVDSEFVSTD